MRARAPSTRRDTSAIARCAWQDHHPPRWQGREMANDACWSLPLPSESPSLHLSSTTRTRLRARPAGEARWLSFRCSEGCLHAVCHGRGRQPGPTQHQPHFCRHAANPRPHPSPARWPGSARAQHSESSSRAAPITMTAHPIYFRPATPSVRVAESRGKPTQLEELRVILPQDSATRTRTTRTDSSSIAGESRGGGGCGSGPS
jgi:hypothetical protein